jgi:hypothetical protein
VGWRHSSGWEFYSPARRVGEVSGPWPPGKTQHMACYHGATLTPYEQAFNQDDFVSTPRRGHTSSSSSPAP